MHESGKFAIRNEGRLDVLLVTFVKIHHHTRRWMHSRAVGLGITWENILLIRIVTIFDTLAVEEVEVPANKSVQGQRMSESVCGRTYR